MTTQQYIQSITQRYNLGNATEHTFRGDLQLLIETLVPDIRATNEPSLAQVFQKYFQLQPGSLNLPLLALLAQVFPSQITKLKSKVIGITWAVLILPVCNRI